MIFLQAIKLGKKLLAPLYIPSKIHLAWQAVNRRIHAHVDVYLSVERSLEITVLMNDEHVVRLYL